MEQKISLHKPLHRGGGYSPESRQGDRHLPPAVQEEGTDGASGAGRWGGLEWDGQRYHSDEVCVLSGAGRKWNQFVG